MFKFLGKNFAKTLAQIKKDVPIDFNLKECQWKEYNKEKTIQIFKNLEFHSLIKRLPTAKTQKENPVGETLKLW